MVLPHTHYHTHSLSHTHTYRERESVSKVYTHTHTHKVCEMSDDRVRHAIHRLSVAADRAECLLSQRHIFPVLDVPDVQDVVLDDGWVDSAWEWVVCLFNPSYE